MYHLSIGTSTNRINLLDEHGIYVHDWEPIAGDIEIYRSSSPLADYSRPIGYRERTTEETFPFNIGKPSQDGVVVGLQDLRRMCRATIDYWVEGWKDEPVYLAAQSNCETNRRYAIVHSAGVPRDDDPYGQPFVGSRRSIMVIDALGLERGPWLDTPPGIATCIEACAPKNYYCWPSFLEFAASADDVNCGRGWGAIDDLPPAPGFTVESWVRADGWATGLQNVIASKWDGTVGWQFHIDPLHGLCAWIEFGGQDAISYSGTDEFTPDGLWHHVAMTFSPIGAGWGNNGYIRLWIDGTEVASYTTQQQGQGAYATDVALDFIIGNNLANTRPWDGAIGWVHTGIQPWWQDDFIPNPRCEIPPPTVYQGLGIISEGLWITEGTGATTINRIIPGTGDGTITGAEWDCDCVLSYGRMCGDLENCWPAYCNFDGAFDSIRSADYAEIRSLPDDGNEFTVEAWIKAAGWGENNLGRICSKENNASTDGWYIGLDNAEGLYFFVYGGGGGADGEASSGLDEFSLGNWVHVVGTVTPTGGANATLNLAVGGTWVASYATHVNKTGNYQQDLGDALWFGNRTDGARTFDGSIGWIRFSTSLRYTVGVDFTPPDRCALPGVDADTAGIWINEGFGTQTWNLAFGEPALLSSSTMWDCDCEYEVDQSTSCIAQPYIVNHLKTSGLTDIYFTDVSAPSWSGNLLYTPLPHLLLPPVPAVNDAIYFGVDTTLRDSGPFSSLVFDLVPYGGAITGQWEYWQGGGPGWTNIDARVQDNTNAGGLMTAEAFGTAGIASVHWQGSSLDTWAIIDLPTASGDVTAPTVTGWWIRWRVTVAAGASAPQQQNRHVYTISWPYIQIEDNDVPGDIAASLALELFNESDHDGGSTEPKLLTSRLICGLRSLDRGEGFVGFMNAADEQNPPFINFSKGAAWTWGSVGSIAIGRYIFYLVPNGTVSEAGEWVIDANYTRQFYGEYRAFIRGYTNGDAGDVSLKLELTYGHGRGASASSEYVNNQHPLVDNEVFDMGRFVIPPTTRIKASEDAELGISVTARNNHAADDRLVRIYDIILIPVDEWAGDFTGTPNPWSDYLGGNRSMAIDDWGGLGRYLLIDSIGIPRYDLRAASLIRDTGNFTGLVEVVGGRPASLKENQTQRIWFLAIRNHNSGADWSGDFEIAHSVQVYSQANYLSMRGNR